MRWFINDSSLRGQFTGKRDELLNIIRNVVRFRDQYSEFKDKCYISSEIGLRPVDSNLNLFHVLSQNSESSDEDMRISIRRFLDWCKSVGPFIFQAMIDRFDGVIEYDGKNVSNEAIGVAAMNKHFGTKVALFSFSGAGEEFEADSILVEHKFESTPNQIEVCNIWKISVLKSSIEAVEPEQSVNNWGELIPFLKSKFLNLEFDSTDADSMEEFPFTISILERIIERCGILNEYAENLDGGQENDRAKEIKRDFFQGKRAWFTSESERNKETFKKEMTFQSVSGESYKAYYHGKISSHFGPFRIHFEYPLRNPNVKKLEIFYIGPKISSE